MPRVSISPVWWTCAAYTVRDSISRRRPKSSCSSGSSFQNAPSRMLPDRGERRFDERVCLVDVGESGVVHRKTLLSTTDSRPSNPRPFRCCSRHELITMWRAEKPLRTAGFSSGGWAAQVSVRTFCKAQSAFGVDTPYSAMNGCGDELGLFGTGVKEMNNFIPAVEVDPRRKSHCLVSGRACWASREAGHRGPLSVVRSAGLGRSGLGRSDPQSSPAGRSAHERTGAANGH